jgi:hypothetical protein
MFKGSKGSSSPSSGLSITPKSDSACLASLRVYPALLDAALIASGPCCGITAKQISDIKARHHAGAFGRCEQVSADRFFDPMKPGHEREVNKTRATAAQCLKRSHVLNPRSYEAVHEKIAAISLR